MKDTTIGLLVGERITGDSFDAKLAQLGCFVAGVLVLAVSFWKLTRLDLSEPQLLFGVLLSLCAPLLLIVVGLLLPVAAAQRKPKA